MPLISTKTATAQGVDTKTIIASSAMVAVGVVANFVAAGMLALIGMKNVGQNKIVRISSPVFEVCGDLIDNNSNGFTDCNDSACLGSSACQNSRISDISISGSDNGLQVQSVQFLRGDFNADGKLDLADVVYSLNRFYRNGEEFSCLDSADADDDGTVTQKDPIALMKFLFSGGILGSDGNSCEFDVTTDSLDCNSYASYYCPSIASGVTAKESSEENFQINFQNCSYIRAIDRENKTTYYDFAPPCWELVENIK